MMRCPSCDHCMSSTAADSGRCSTLSTGSQPSVCDAHTRTLPPTSAEATHSPLGWKRATVAWYPCPEYTCHGLGR
jgi:hypothetical protein